MRRGLTLIELIFVIVIIGILSAVLVPRFDRPTLDQAANQIVSHIRYTQHLAMVNNKFNPTDEFWYRKRWQIRFQYKGSSPREYYYTIYADKDGDDTLEQVEIAVNAINPRQILTGNMSIATDRYTKPMNLYETYGIKKVGMTGCIDGGVSGSLRVAFDYLGRPIVKNIYALDNAYVETSANEVRLVSKLCKITLTDIDNNTKQIAIEPETGYTHIILSSKKRLLA